MANTLLTPTIIAREALVRLESTQVMGGLVHTEYSKEFKQVGDTITVRKPAVFTADEFSTTISAQNVTEASVSVTLDIHADVSVEITTKELSLDIVDFGAQVIDGAVIAINELVDQKLCALYKDVFAFTGASGTTPSALSDITDPMKVLNIAKVPMAQRRIVFDPISQAELLQLDSLVEVDKSGWNQGLRNANMGRVMGFDTYMDQNVTTHTAGDYTALTDLTSNGIQAVGATTFNIESAAGTSTDTVLEGDIFTIETGSAAGQYVVTADSAAAVAGAVTVSIYPALRGATADTDTVAFADETAGAHIPSLAFHRNAFALVSAPLAVPLGATNASAYTAQLPNGLSMRVVMGYDNDSKKNLISFDCLFGVKTLYPELACRILG